jgi:alcohol dehydrogenase class IV
VNSPATVHSRSGSLPASALWTTPRRVCSPRRASVLSNTLALEGLRRLRRGLLAAREDPADVEACTEAQLGAWFGFTLPGSSAAGLSHTLGKRIGPRHSILHGVIPCLLLPS